MNIDQIEGMYKKLTNAFGIRMTPHRFRHTLATDLMRQPDRNIHLTKTLLNHSNIATTMSYIEVDYDHMRAVLDERSLYQGAIRLERREDLTRPIPPAPKFLPTGADDNQHGSEDFEPRAVGDTSAAVDSLPEVEAPTARDLLSALPRQKRPEKYPLEQLCEPMTGLSHDLGWEGPGTLWADLGIPPCGQPEDSFDPAALMDIMPIPNVVGTHRWN